MHALMGDCACCSAAAGDWVLPSPLQEYSDVSALLYTLRVVLGDGALPTRPPGSELASLSCDCAGSAGTLSTLSDADDMGLLARGGKAGGRAGYGLS